MFPTESGAERPRRDWLPVGLALGGLLLLYYAVPLLSLLVAQPAGDVLAKLGDPDVVSATRTSVASAAVTTAIATALGLPLAYWLARGDSQWTTLATALVVLPLVLPPVVSGMVVLTVVGPGTALGEAATAAGVRLTRSLVGVVLAQLFVASPFVVVTSAAAFESVDRELEYASRSLGRTRLRTFREVTLPLAWPGILAGMTLTFARAIGEFGATIMLAYYPRTMPVQIWVSFSTLGLDDAFPVAVVLLGVAVAALVALDALGSNPWRGT